MESINNFVGRVYDSLSQSTEEISKTVDEYEQITAEMNGGRFSEKVIQGEMLPKQTALRRKIRDDSEAAIAAANAIVDEYEREIDESFAVDPEQLTDDVKLLQPGIILNERDISVMLKRNADNPTMQQLILRYAHARKISTGKFVSSFGQRERESANAIRSTIHYYAKRIGTKDAKDMLSKYFSFK